MKELELIDFTVKSGWKTTENWFVLAAQGLAFLTLVGVISSADVAELEPAVNATIDAVGALALSLGTIWKYIDSRTQVKVATETNKGKVIDASTVQLE